MDNDFYTMTDAMVLCMKQPGAVAVAFVEMDSGRAIAGDGANNIDLDEVITYFSDFVTYCCNIDCKNTKNTDRQSLAFVEASWSIVITTDNHIHLLYPMTRTAQGLYLYLALNRLIGKIPLSQRCLTDIDEKLYL